MAELISRHSYLGCSGFKSLAEIGDTLAGEWPQTIPVYLQLFSLFLQRFRFPFPSG